MTKLAVISAGLGTPSTTRLVADQLEEGAERALSGPVETTHVALREHAHAIADALLAGYASDELADALKAVQQADAVIAVTPVFQGSFSGLFKSFIDLIEPQTLRHKPVLLAATGGSERHSLVVEYALRPVFSYLGATTVPTGIYAATGDFGSPTRSDDWSSATDLDRRISRAVSELAVLTSLNCTGSTEAATATAAEQEPLAEAQHTLSQAAGRPVTDFGDLLRALGQE